MKKKHLIRISLVGMIGMMVLTGCESHEEYDPKINENECVYGPPESFDPSDNENVDVYGPPEPYEEDNE